MPGLIYLHRSIVRSFVRAGCPVVPLFEPIGSGCSCGNPDCSRQGKHPCSDWKHDAIRDLARVDEVWGQAPYRNFGVLTGEYSNLFVLDIDGDEGFQTLRKLRGDAPKLDRRIGVSTGRGEHYYFNTEGRQVRSRRLGPGLEIKGDGGYVVGPGSLHKTGVPYWFLDGCSEPWKSFLPGAVPEWLAEALEAGDRPATVSGPEGGVAKQPQRYGAAALRAELDHLLQVREGGRNNALNLSAFRLGQLVGAGMLNETTVYTELVQVGCAIGLERSEAEATARSGITAGRKKPRTPLQLTEEGATTPTAVARDPLAEELAKLGLTDTGNAERLSRRFAGRLAHTPGKGYLLYDGARWRRDEEAKRLGFAQETARKIALEAHFLARDEDRAARTRFADQTLSKGGLDRMLSLAQPLLTKLDAQLDADPFSLNVANGTLDLRTGELRPHRPEDLLTKLVPIPYDPGAICPTLERFLEVAFGGDADLIAYLQRALGYSLTGDMGEQVFFFVHGPGSTGKSTLVNSFRDLLGDYAVHTPTETFTARQHEGIPSDVARLDGVRLITSVEVNWHRQIDEARVKALTGGDPITARYLHREWFQFKPVGKLWFVANDYPGVRGTAEAFWRRVHVIPMTVAIREEDRDQGLAAKLKAEVPGILAWAVRGCLAWRDGGLRPPEAVRRGTEGWQRKADHLQRFADEAIIQVHDDCVQAQHLYERYQGWCRQHGESPLDTRRFKAALEGRGLVSERRRTGNFWTGVKLRMEG